ncbi:MAG: hypothetical protein ACLQVN_23040, partial [Bryobacteraceae bacterium]
MKGMWSHAGTYRGELSGVRREAAKGLHKDAAGSDCGVPAKIEHGKRRDESRRGRLRVCSTATLDKAAEFGKAMK